MSIREYNRKRKFKKTPEPAGKKEKSGSVLRFVVQKHAASRLHFDFRLEMGGVLKSWAVPKGPSLNPADQRLAVYVEDHPIDYGTFEGVIPKGNYGAGTVMVWDSGTYWARSEDTPDAAKSEKKLLDGLKKGHLTILLNGHKLKGEFALIRLKRGGDEKSWLLVKKRDSFSSYKGNILDQDKSVKTGRSLKQIKDTSEKKGDVWLPKKGRIKAKKESWIAPKTNDLNSQRPKLELKGKSTSILDLENATQTKPKAEKFPRRLKPMLPTFHKKFEKAGWFFEPSFGGVRAIAEIKDGRANLYSKQLLSFNRKYPEILKELRKIKQDVVLDGEVYQDKKEIIFSVFDLLHLDGKNFRVLPLKARKLTLKKLKIFGKNIKFCPHVDKTTKIKKSPAILARDSTSSYKTGTSRRWLKIKVIEDKKVKAASPQEVQGMPKDFKPSGLVKLTNLNKIYWPEESYTKGDLVYYYDQISKVILPYLKDFPQSLNRHPNGIEAPNFFQKDVIGYLPKFVHTKRLYSESAEKTIDYLLCQNKETLLYIANLGCIEINPWLSKVKTLDKPEYVVIDLDPNGADFRDVVEIANETRRVLDLIGAKSFCKTSGSTGLHICIPTGAKFDYDACREFAFKVCQVVIQKFEDVASLERSPSKRRGKIYLDYMQNRRAQTLAAPYCVRPKPGATVSTPLEWNEVRSRLDPAKFTIRTIFKRLEKKGDLWEKMLSVKVDLKKCSKKLNDLLS